MFELYAKYWKNTFNYSKDVSVKEILTALFFNLLIVVFVLFIGIIVPITWENLIMDLWYLIIGIMILPTFSLLVRMVRTSMHFLRKN